MIFAEEKSLTKPMQNSELGGTCVLKEQQKNRKVLLFYQQEMQPLWVQTSEVINFKGQKMSSIASLYTSSDRERCNI